jgi:hypothetical protein
METPFSVNDYTRTRLKTRRRPGKPKAGRRFLSHPVFQLVLLLLQFNARRRSRFPAAGNQHDDLSVRAICQDPNRRHKTNLRAYASKFPETTPYFKKYGREIHTTKSAIP